MKILLSGASGLIGSALRLELRRAGHEVVALSRDGAGSGAPWEVDTGRVFLGDFAPDALIHLAGESIVSGKWTEERKQSIRASRVEATRRLADWFSMQPNRPRIVLSASAVGIYGNRNDKWLIETSPPSSEFLGQLCHDWEKAMQPLERGGSRVVSMRFGIVLSREGGALAKMLPYFKWGLGGPLGDGSQWMSWITLDDAVRAIFFLLENDNLSGPINVTTPNPVTNREFAQTLARTLKRPAMISTPGALLHMIYGEMAEEALLASQRVRPLFLEEHAFQWGHPDLDLALAAILRRKMKAKPKTNKAPQYVLGVDFGTLSARALLVDTLTGQTCATAVAAYKHGVIERALPGSAAPLPADTALQDPDDYLRALEKTVRAAVSNAGAAPESIVGIGIDFTCCTVLPTTRDGVPLCFDAKWRKNPHAWAKLWKHHAAQPQADAINRAGTARDEEFLKIYGGKYSSEWLFSKLLETLQRAPSVYGGMDRFIEAGDWMVWQLCGEEKRGLSAAGFKAMRVCGENGDAFPGADFLAALDPSLRDSVKTKLDAAYLKPGERAGGLTPAMARRLGLSEGTPVAVANIDAHAGVAGCGVTTPGKLVIIMGTSSCHLLLSEKNQAIQGVCGVVKDGVVPGLFAYEAGQAGVGDSFAWFVERLAPKGLTHEQLEKEAAKLKPGQSGLLALDWWNGSRFQVDADLSGVIVGLKLNSEPAAIYRALIEATAFGTRRIIEAFTSKGIAVDQVIVCGGLTQNALLLQIYADVTGRTLKVAASDQASALGSAVHAAVAAGVYKDLSEAASKMTEAPNRKYVPNKKARAVYDELYAEYLRLHAWFGDDSQGVLKRLKTIAVQAE